MHEAARVAMVNETILYEDNHLLVVIKPAGVLAQGDKTGDASILEQGKAYLKEKYRKPGAVFLGLVHRLDRPVSGVMVLARTSKAADRLCAQFRERTTEKIYRAVVEGRPPEDAGRLEHWLTGDEHRLKVSVSPKERPGAKKATLLYRVLRSRSGRSELEVELVTGLKHQIRAQLAAIGCPVVGDFKYDHRKGDAAPERLWGGRAIALHAARLTIAHPTKKEALTFAAPLPEYWPKI
jgi:23S rRNA pseudouridine1911/1915/1917 synthase